MVDASSLQKYHEYQYFLFENLIVFDIALYKYVNQVLFLRDQNINRIADKPSRQ